MNIKEARTASGLTIAEVSKYLKVPRRTIEDWEAKKRNCKREDEIIKKIRTLEVFTKEGREGIRDGIISWDEAYQEYVIAMAKRISKVGTFGDTFSACLSSVPEDLLTKLSPEDLAALVDAFHGCYQEGRKQGK